MMLEHDTYREAVSDVTLSDEAGLEMLENAIKRKERWSQRWKAQTLAVVAGIMVVALSVNGICFAATGMNAWDLFRSIYRENSKEAEVISQNFQKVEDYLVDGNLQHTLEKYWYDSDAGMAYFIIRTDSLDGSPVDVKEDSYEIDPHFNHRGLMSVESGEPIVSEDKASVWKYYHIMISYNERDGYEDFAAGSAEALVVSLEVKDGGPNEDGEQPYKALGSFVMEPTDIMKMKRLELDCSALEDCTGINIVGGGMKLSFDKGYGREFEEDFPFGILELKMKDGSSSFVVGELPEGNWQTENEDNGEITGFKSAEMDLTGDKLLGVLGSSGSSFDGYSKSGYSSEFNCMFNRFIDIDDVAGVYVDGVELPIK